MKFILWTLVCFGLDNLYVFVNEYLLKNTYSDNVSALSFLIHVFLWIFLYFKIISKEDAG